MSEATEPPAPPGMGGVTPLWAVLTVTFFGSLGTGSVGNGLFFIAKNQHDFGRLESFGLGLTLGLVYIPSALIVGPALRRLIAWSPAITSRRVVGVQAMLLALGCFTLGALKEAEWAVWAFAAGYGAITGSHWPLVEGFLSGGRKGERLRSAVGRFNIVWTFAVAVAILAMTLVIRDRPMDVVLVLGLGHAASMIALVWFPKEPGKHLSDEPHEVPGSYHRLLKVNRVLLPVSYVLLSALNPYWPHAFETIGLVGGAQTALASVWMFSRFGVVVGLERWHGWHGTRTTPVLGTVALGLGFALGVLVPIVGADREVWVGVTLALLALVCFGVGMAVIYTGALYYGLEVGADGASEGGTHEGLIGFGYSVGPLIGVAAVGSESGFSLADGTFRWLMLVLAGAVFAVAAGYAARIAFRGGRASNRGGSA